MINNLVYILIFSPLIGSLAIQILAVNNFLLKAVTSLLFILLFIISSLLMVEVIEVNEISANLSFDSLSIGLEYYADLISLIFILIILILKFNQIFQIDRYSLDLKDSNNFKNYLSLQFVSIFCIIGIIISSNIFNIFIFLELYILTNIVINSFGRDDKFYAFFNTFLKVNIIATMVLASIFVLIVIFTGEYSVSGISNEISKGSNASYLQILIIAIIVIYSIKLFYSWFMNIKNIKNLSILLSQFYSTSFLNTNIALFLIIKFYHILAIFNFISIAIGFISIIFILYCSVKLFFAKHMRLQISMICASIFLLALSSLIIKNDQSVTSFVFYLFILNSIVLVIFNIFFFVSVNFNINNIYEFSFIRSGNGFFLRLLSYIFILMLLMLFPLPYAPTFFANYFLISAIFENNDLQLLEFTNILDSYYLLTVLVFQSAMMYFCYRYIVQSLDDTKLSKVGCGNKYDGYFILINIVILSIIAFCFLNIEIFTQFGNRAKLIFLS